jgi:SAM-dependent methyltransferase
MKKILKIGNALFPFIYILRHYLNGNFFKSIYYYIKNILTYCKINNTEFKFKMTEAYPCLFDRFEDAGTLTKHYFLQDIWAAQKVYKLESKLHFDIGSRLDGFIAHCLVFTKVTLLDIRPLNHKVDNLNFIQTNCMKMDDIETGTIHSLSCLHAIEHFGLGRYGDPINPLGHIIAINEIKRVTAPEGNLIISVPIGIERLNFDAHRVFNPEKFINLFSGFELIEFSAIDDHDLFIKNANIKLSSKYEYGCGLFHFKKNR